MPEPVLRFSAAQTKADLVYGIVRADKSEADMSHLRQAVTIFAEIGVEAGSMQPEIWKLVEW